MNPTSTTATAGLRGTSAGRTALCTVGKEGAGLRYRGYDIQTLAAQATFEEVAYLLLYGEPPTRAQLDSYIARLKTLREVPATLREVLERTPASAHPMDVMRTGCSSLGTMEPETDFSRQHDAIDRMLAVFPGMINYWYHYTTTGKRIDTVTDEDSIAAHFLHLLHGKPPAAEQESMMHASLILYAEHEFNASTFAARVCASTLSDVYSCITAAIGTLRGPLHGGANEAAMDMLAQWSSPQQAEQAILTMLARKEKIMGFGHAIYRHSDPRNAVVKAWAQRLAISEADRRLYAVAEQVEQVMQREKGLFANADFYHACAYHSLGIPTYLFTPIFVCSRLTGWAAHVMEQRADNRIIRPSADYTGPETASWIPLHRRG